MFRSGLMKIATFNVNSLRSRLPLVLEWLRENRPDVLAVQETKVQDIDFPADAFDDSGYEYVFKGQKTYNGVAIFSRSKITNVQYGFDDEPKDQARLIKAQIKGIAIVNTYIPQGQSPESEKFEYKLNWFGRLREFFERNFRPTDAVLWAGDFNVAPEAIDVYDPERLWGHVCFHPEVCRALSETMRWGFVDVFRIHCRQAGRYTFWDYRERDSVKHNHGWRLDHIMATKPLAEKSINCCIDKEMRFAERPSDHTVVVAEFDW